ncbi:MAG: hypothetical protein JWO32_2763, partial [Bacteroidetes bacterium]|nr:hypothetical protein [Bacteroidota bacterium]
SIYNNNEDLRQTFTVSTDVDKARDVIKLITDKINSFEYINHNKGKEVLVMADSLSSDRIKINITFWYDPAKSNQINSQTKSEIMLAVFQELRSAGIEFRG